jgi:hypothetical protein
MTIPHKAPFVCRDSLTFFVGKMLIWIWRGSVVLEWASGNNIGAIHCRVAPTPFCQNLSYLGIKNNHHGYLAQEFFCPLLLPDYEQIKFHFANSND